MRTMTRDADRVSLSGRDFRSERQHLAAHVFALGGDIPDPAPDNLVSEEAWRDLIDLLTDVLLRATSYAGGVVDHLRELISCWHEDGFSQVDTGSASSRQGSAALRGGRSSVSHRAQAALESHYIAVDGSQAHGIPLPVEGPPPEP